MIETKEIRNITKAQEIICFLLGYFLANIFHSLVLNKNVIKKIGK